MNHRLEENFARYLAEVQRVHVEGVAKKPRPVGTAIRERRKGLGVTQEQLADRAGLTVRALIDIESGKANPHDRNRKALMDAL
jgi:ribosome-binding protein aMBF1 (putative translation factor)